LAPNEVRPIECAVFPLITRKLHCSQLHFSNPAAYNDIYNHRNKWDKDHSLYRAFDLDTSTFGIKRYSDAKQRRDVLAPFFSRTSIVELQDLIKERVGRSPTDELTVSFSYERVR